MKVEHNFTVVKCSPFKCIAAIGNGRTSVRPGKVSLTVVGSSGETGQGGRTTEQIGS